jgi:predicted kinase
MIKMPKITFLVGVPGSGKSTWRSRNASDEVVISSGDAIEAFAAANDLTYAEAFETLDLKVVEKDMRTRYAEAVATKSDIIIDRTNISKKTRNKFLSSLPKIYIREAIVFTVAPEVLAERLRKRQMETGKYVPAAVVEHFSKSFEMPEAPEFDVVTVIS